MKYIKKDEFKGIRHNLKDKSGKLFIIEDDVMENDEIYELKKFMFDIVKEEIQVIKKIEKIEIIPEEKQEIANEIIETFIEEMKQEENIFVNDSKEEIVEDKKEKKKNKK